MRGYNSEKVQRFKCESKGVTEKDIAIIQKKIDIIEQSLKKQKKGYAINKHMGTKRNRLSDMLGYIKHSNGELYKLKKQLETMVSELNNIERIEHTCN